MVEVNQMAVLLSNLMKGYKAGDTPTILWECMRKRNVSSDE